MKVVITGAAGFLGSHLVDRFLADGHEVTGIDNFITGSPDNVAHLMGRPDFQFIQLDVTNYIYVDGAVDGVLHFASPASPIDYLELPIPTLKVGSLGTHKTLGLAKAKGARYLLASTSEVYGDPLVHPQPETYWGNVNPVGPRGVYDEAKRFAEALTMAYHRYHGLDTRIVRIFNSVLADEPVLLFNDADVHLEPIEEYCSSIQASLLEVPRHVQVPSFDPDTLRVELRTADALIKHPSGDGDAFRISTRYGRRIQVTGDHSVFRRGVGEQPEPIPVRNLAVGDHIAIPARLPVIERDVRAIHVSKHLMDRASGREELWGYALVSPELRAVADTRKDEIFDQLLADDRYAGSRSKRNTIGCAWRRWRKEGALPLAVVDRLRRSGFDFPADARVRPYPGRLSIPDRIEIDDDVLWLLGIYLAEGCRVDDGKTYRLLISSNLEFVRRASDVLKRSFGVDPTVLEPSANRSPSLYVDSKVLLYVFDRIFGVTGYSHDLRIPSWIFQLPLSRLKHFLEGYREGDGTHTRYLERRELAFNTVSERLATDLTYLLLRFGIVASVGHYETGYRKKYGDRKFPFWRVTVCEVSDFDILRWDEGIEQTLNARRSGDLVWALVTNIEPVSPSRYVYDFSVPGHENFVAGTGVFAHNTYGPRMRPADGRVVSNFIVQALRGEPLTVYGDGSQTRSFCYAEDEVEGIYRLFNSDRAEPTNVGNPVEFTIQQLAELVLEETGSVSPIDRRPLPTDDPRVRQPDISIARRALGWEPGVSLREGLRRTIPYFRKLVEERGAGARTLPA